MNYNEIEKYLKGVGIITKKEWIIIVGIVIAALLGILGYNFYNAQGKTNYEVKITQNTNVIRLLPLNQDYEEKISDGDAYNVVQIKDGKVSVTEANCANQICVRSQAISQPGETIACLPHKLLIEIVQEGNE